MIYFVIKYVVIPDMVNIVINLVLWSSFLVGSFLMSLVGVFSFLTLILFSIFYPKYLDNVLELILDAPFLVDNLSLRNN